MSEKKVGFIGCGQMAQAIAHGLVKSGSIEIQNIMLSDISSAALEKMSSLGFKTTQQISEVLSFCEVVWIAVKPHIVESVLTENKELLRNHFIVSIANGITLANFRIWLDGNGRVARVMPNTACVVRESTSAYSLDNICTDEDEKSLKCMLEAIGTVYKIEERLIDAVVSISGSGIAYFYVMLDALADAGVKGGLPRQVAIDIAAQTALGAGKMVLETRAHPSQLKDGVCSPGGATIDAVAKLEETGFRNSVISAAKAANDRCKNPL